MLGSMVALVASARLAAADDAGSFRDEATSFQFRVASPHAFVLHVAGGPANSEKLSGPDAGIYLAPKATALSPAVAHPSADGSMETKTSFGAIEFDAQAKKWRLLDNSGKVLADWASLAHPAGANIEFTIGASPTSAHPLYYGSGNMPNPGSLTQDSSDGRMGNGRTSLPQFWSSAGYGVLIVGEYGDHPASWKRNADGSVTLSAPGDHADIYLIPAANLYEWTNAITELTGRAPVPPRWTFGYLQSRWGWEDRTYIESTLAEFRRRKLPVDAFIVDFEWYTTYPDYRVPPEGSPDFVDFDWNKKLFPEPAKQIADYARQGLHIVGIRKPRLGNPQALADARQKGWMLQLDPSDTYGGLTAKRNIDYSNPAVRAYWDENNAKFLQAGLAGFWNDEGEQTYTEYAYWNQAETDLFHQVRPGQRFWSINRSFSPGLQRFGAAVWTGDIHADWATLARTPGELLSFGLSGMPYSACDIGGFSGSPTPELLTRWMEAGVFFPVMRAHSVDTATPHFPWLFGSDAENAMRKALELRYRLLPFYELLAHETAQTGEPLMRPLVLDFPNDPKAVGRTDEWMMGDQLLAAPVLTPGTTREVYLPAGGWYDFTDGQLIEGGQTLTVTAALDQIPVYVREGSLLPLGPVRQYTGERSSDPLELRIYSGPLLGGMAMSLIEDDGETTDGPTRMTSFTWREKDKELIWHRAGAYEGPTIFKRVKVVYFSPEGRVEKSAELSADGSIQFKRSAQGMLPGSP